MAFLDKLSDALNSAGEAAMTKGREMAEINKLNNAVSEENRKLNNLIFQLGTAYCQAHGSEPDNEFSQLTAAILEAQKRIETYHAQINELKHLVNCPRCGAMIPQAAMICSNCGYTKPVPQQTNTNDAAVICQHCGLQLPYGSSFCSGCGSRIENRAAHNNAQSICPQCGNQVSSADKFCKSCGNSLNTAKKDETPQPSQQSEVNASPTESVNSASLEVKSLDEELDQALKNFDEAKTQEPCEKPGEETAVEQPIAPENMIKCPICGASVSENNAYCDSCGFKM